jgi:MSHA biogenesis protein MshJ
MKISWSLLSLREKYLLMTTMSILVLVLIYQMVVVPWWSTYQALRQEHQTLLTQNAQLKRDINESIIKNDARKIQQEIEQLIARLTTLDATLAKTLSGVASVNEMAHWLESAMLKSSSLRLLSLETQASIPLSNEVNNRYFIHPLTVRFQGKYWDIVTYLTRLEALPMKYHWQQLHYIVTQFPLAEVTLTVSSVSDRPYWLSSSDSPNLGGNHD